MQKQQQLDKSAFAYDEARDGYFYPQGQTLPHVPTTSETKQYEQATRMVTKDAQEKYELRRHAAEFAFAVIKQHLGGVRQFLLRGTGQGPHGMAVAGMGVQPDAAVRPDEKRRRSASRLTS